jgi:hypothetical protein
MAAMVGSWSTKYHRKFCGPLGGTHPVLFLAVWSSENRSDNDRYSSPPSTSRKAVSSQGEYVVSSGVSSGRTSGTNFKLGMASRVNEVEGSL